MTMILLCFFIYSYLNLVMNSVRILNNSENSLSFRLMYFMTYTVQFPGINTFVAWKWPRAWAETCRQFKITTSNKLGCVLTHLNPSPYCITKHNGHGASKGTNSCFIISLLYSATCFEHCCAHHQGVKLYYTASGIITLCRWPSGAQPPTGRPPTGVTIPDAV